MMCVRRSKKHSAESKLKKSQQHFMHGGNTTAGNYPPFHADAIQGDDSSSLGLQIPIVIAPDENLIDEVVNMDAKPPDQEDTCDFKGPPVKAIKQEKVEVLRRKFARQTVFIDADEMPPENLICSRPIKTECDLNAMTGDLNADVQDEQNSALNLVRVYQVMPDKSDEDQACENTVQQSALTEAATAPESLKDGLRSSENVRVEPIGFRTISERDEQAATLSPCVLDLSITHSEPGSAVSGEISASNGDHCCGVAQRSAPTAIKNKQRLKTRKRESVKFSNLNFKNRHVSYRDWYARLCIRKAKLLYRKRVSTESKPQS